MRFNELPRDVRERFVRLTKDGSDSTVLLRGPRDAARWLVPALAVAGIAITAWLLPQMLSGSLRGIEISLGLAAASIVGTFCGLWWASRLVWRGTPFRPGWYLFSTTWVEASGEFFFVHPIERIRATMIVRAPSGTNEGIRLSASAYDETLVSFFEGMTLDDAMSVIQTTASTLEAARQKGQLATLAAADPFHNVTAKAPAETSGPLVVLAPRWAIVLGVLVALAVGIGLAVSIG